MAEGTRCQGTNSIGINELGTVFGRFGERLEELQQAETKPGAVPDELAEILDDESRELLAVAKSFAAQGGEMTIPLGIAASALEEASWAMSCESWSRVAEGFDELAAQLEQLTDDFLFERDVVVGCAPDDGIGELIADVGYSFGAAGHATRVAGSEIAAGRTTPGIETFLQVGPTFTAIGEGAGELSDGLAALAVWPWSDDCTCGTFEWRRVTSLLPPDQAWVLYDCQRTPGRWCSTCEWTATKERRFHSKKPLGR